MTIYRCTRSDYLLTSGLFKKRIWLFDSLYSFWALISGNVMDCSMMDFDHQMNVNLRSIVQLTQKAVPHLIKTKGSIVNVSSINGPCPVCLF